MYLDFPFQAFWFIYLKKKNKKERKEKPENPSHAYGEMGLWITTTRIITDDSV
jgi:hypothetical protein